MVSHWTSLRIAVDELSILTKRVSIPKWYLSVINLSLPYSGSFQESFSVWRSCFHAPSKKALRIMGALELRILLLLRHLFESVWPSIHLRAPAHQNFCKMNGSVMSSNFVLLLFCANVACLRLRLHKRCMYLLCWHWGGRGGLNSSNHAITRNWRAATAEPASPLCVGLTWRWCRGTIKEEKITNLRL